jgi:serine acetyltransferase
MAAMAVLASQRYALVSAASTFVAAVRADHAALLALREKYSRAEGESSRPFGLMIDVVTKIGFQMMVVIRMMHWARDTGATPLAALLSRALRHLYAAEIHWRAHFEPGVCIVHGTGLVIAQRAVVGSGCVLFQGVTLGDSSGRTGTTGAPTLARNVHVGANAVLIGPITVGDGTKVAANTRLDCDVPPYSLVSSPAAQIVSRDIAAAARSSR